ncbi:TspO/MBR family protein [Actinacidiphila paucisporea]|uniref:TspO/MBR family protein n=1 Tax=Actinacidiphila paucisporea TaxID=310782 RepID=UPI001F24D2B2|nr:TspO/MBR family protein [Actinacidiphila paucisporea]
MASTVAAAAVVGSRPIDPADAWYSSLDKPSWQPPGWAFPVVWTPLYAGIAWAGSHSLLHAEKKASTRLAAALAGNLVLNSAFGWAFFKARTPVAGLAVTTALSLSCWDLVRRTAAQDNAAAAALVPYASWCTFATALNADIWRRNPGMRAR